jgi:amino acid permease
LLYTFEEGEVILEDGFGSDSKPTSLHVIFDIFHLIFDAVLVFEFPFGLQMLKDLKDNLPFLFDHFLGISLPTFFFTFDFHQEILVKIVLKMRW